MPAKKGGQHYAAKLDEAKVASIRRELVTACPCCGRKPSQRMLASKYGVSTVAIHLAVHGANWKHVEADA